ncbi:mechanosensitive ion channel family protein [Halovenus halobia]|uniref:mechanosensitive ion channel family protein n=1 Tax=Halovenus halobia TaxID=3396622 RepID=UPI003F55F896
MGVPSGVAGQGRFNEIRLFLEGLATTEGRLAVSVGVFLLAVAFVVVTPWIVRRVGRRVRKRFPEGRTANAVDVVGEYIPRTISGLLLRALQVTVLGSAAIALLIVWGQVDIAFSALSFVFFTLPVFGQVTLTGVIFLLAYIASDLFEQTIRDLSEDAEQITDHQQEVVTRVGNLTVFIFAIGATLTLWGLNLSGLLVGAGFLGIVVGMAARQTLGSMVAGFVLMFSRPFTIGDWVEVGDNEGIVTEITIMNTRMRNFDGESIVIPNDIVSNHAVVNRSDQGHLRLRLDVAVDYESDPGRAEEVALEAISSVDSVATSPPPAAIPTEFGDSAIVLELRFWIDRPTPPRKWRATREVINGVKRSFDEEGIKIPFPQRELSDRVSQDRVSEGESESEPAEQRAEVSSQAED